MSYRRERVQTQTVSLEDDLDNLQHNMDTQPLATTSTSFGAFSFLDTSTTGMFKIIMISMIFIFNFSNNEN